MHYYNMCPIQLTWREVDTVTSLKQSSQEIKFIDLNLCRPLVRIILDFRTYQKFKNAKISSAINTSLHTPRPFLS